MKFKDILPFEDYLIKTNLSVEEINFRLNENIAPKSKSIFSSFYKNATKPYEGYIYSNKFSISRIISYRNSFLPKITGDIFTLEGLTNVRVKMETNRMMLMVWYLLTFIFFPIILSFNNVFSGVNTTNNAALFNFVSKLIPFIFFITFLITPSAAFKKESRKSKKFLSALLEERN
jgi:hypothetical protein